MRACRHPSIPSTEDSKATRVHTNPSSSKSQSQHPSLPSEACVRARGGIRIQSLEARARDPADRVRKTATAVALQFFQHWKRWLFLPS